MVAPHDALPGAGCLQALLDAVAHRPRAGLACADVGDGHTPYLDPYFGGITMPAGDDVGRRRVAGGRTTRTAPC